MERSPICSAHSPLRREVGWRAIACRCKSTRGAFRAHACTKARQSLMCWPCQWQSACSLLRPTSSLRNSSRTRVKLLGAASEYESPSTTLTCRRACRPSVSKKGTQTLATQSSNAITELPPTCTHWAVARAIVMVPRMRHVSVLHSFWSRSLSAHIEQPWRPPPARIPPLCACTSRPRPCCSACTGHGNESAHH